MCIKSYNLPLRFCLLALRFAAKHTAFCCILPCVLVHIALRFAAKRKAKRCFLQNQNPCSLLNNM